MCEVNTIYNFTSLPSKAWTMNLLQIAVLTDMQTCYVVMTKTGNLSLLNRTLWRSFLPKHQTLKSLV